MNYSTRFSINSKCIFSIGFLVLFPLLVLLSAELYDIREHLSIEILNLKEQLEQQLNKSDAVLRAELHNTTSFFDQELQEIKLAPTEHDQAVLDYLTETFDTELNKSITEINETIQQQSNQVQ